MRFSAKYLVLLLVLASCSAAKKSTIPAPNVVANLKMHIGYLADDKLEGRRTGTAGEKLAMEYISDQFKQIGLAPKGTEGYYQAFDVNDGRAVEAATVLRIGNVTLVEGKEWFPLAFSASKKLDAQVSVALQEVDSPWFFDLKGPLEENRNNPHFDLNDYIYTNSRKVVDRGATAVILFNSGSTDDELAFKPKDHSEPLSIPVVYITHDAAAKYLSDITATQNISLNVVLGERHRTGHNVIGYIDNGAANTVVLGAHFDHLGYGEDGNSMLRNGEHLIHNGADDNASGTAALIELGRQLKKANAKGNNYLFIAFSGEELGLFGSKHFVDNPTIDLKKVDYMINMDMVGRLNDTSRVLTVGGVGTSPAWGEVFPPEPTDGRMVKRYFMLKYDSSGTGPSDHTSFYRKDIPVLFYFTGLHADYHKPSDDADKINYAGEEMIIRNIMSVIEHYDTQGKLPFTKTRETQSTSSASFKVTLGIMPDYTFAGAGVRADGVTDGRPASKAGMKAGDIIVQLGDYTVNSMETYMQALGKFKKGDHTTVKFKRGNEVLTGNVEF